MARRGGDGDRPKKTWREIDKMRGKSRESRADAQREERLQKSQAYREYKSNLDKFFDGTGSAPEGLKGLLDPSGAKSARSTAMEEIAKASASDRKKWAELVTRFVEEHELPPDPYFLVEVLGHPKERVAGKALAKLAAMAEAGELKKIPASLDQLCRSLELTADDDDLKAAAKALREKLRG